MTLQRPWDARDEKSLPAKRRTPDTVKIGMGKSQHTNLRISQMVTNRGHWIVRGPGRVRIGKALGIVRTSGALHDTNRP